MAISSFKGFLRTGKPSSADYTRSLHTVLTGVSRYTVDGSEEELSTFRESMLALASNIQEQSGTVEVESTVGSALDLFRDYNQRSLLYNETRSGEFKAVMRTMTETITYLSESRTRSVHQLQFVERELEQAAKLDDIKQLRTRLSACLDVVREETERLQTEVKTRAQDEQQQVEEAKKAAAEPISRFGIMDAVTGLPGRHPAERVIKESLAQERRHALAVFVVTRLSAINGKYGRAVGDEVMLRVANHFARNLSDATFLYRWSGPALVALIDVPDSAEEIQKSWAKLASGKLEINLESKERIVYVMVETAMSFQVITRGTSETELFRSLDQFVAEAGDTPCG